MNFQQRIMARLTVIICVMFALFEVSTAMTQTKRLVKKLFDDDEYDKRIRPVLNESVSTYVEMLLYVSSILDMDERRQILKTNIWLTFNWVDELLRWDPDEFGGLRSFKITSDVIWKPDITLYNSDDEERQETVSDNTAHETFRITLAIADYSKPFHIQVTPRQKVIVKTCFDKRFVGDNGQTAADSYIPYMDGKVVVVNSTGDVNWASPAIFMSHCRISVTHFPFDRQECELKFGPWQYDGHEVVLEGKGDETVYISDGEWDMQSVTVTSKSQMYPDAPGIPYYDVTYKIQISRRSNYYVFNLILPCVLISGITTLVFILPADSGEKVSLGITVLLSLTVFLLIIAESMPATSDVPVIGQYYAATMLLVSISVVLTIIVLNLHHGGPYLRPVPAWMRRVILKKLARFLRLDPSQINDKKGRKYGFRPFALGGMRQEEGIETKKDRFQSDFDDLNMTEIHKLAHHECPDSPLLSMNSMNGSVKGGSRKQTNPTQEQRPSLSEQTVLLRRLVAHLLFFRERAERHDVTESVLEEWKKVAFVVDRTFMILYLVLSFATMLIIVLQVDIT